jgi:hypothetical protein
MALKIVEELSIRFVTFEGKIVNQFLYQGQAPLPIPRVGERVKLPPKDGSRVLGYTSHGRNDYGKYDIFRVVDITNVYTRSYQELEPGENHLGIDYEVIVTVEPADETTYA